MLSTSTILGHQPNIHILDNEASYIIKQGFINNKIKYHLVPPHLHGRNASERAIQIFKARFITCLCAANPDYPAKEQYCFLPQANTTLNLLRKFCFNAKFPAYAALHGIFYYNKTSLASLGTILLVHNNTTNHFTWSPHGTDRWYVGPALEQYNCVECYMPLTHSTSISDIVEFLPTVVPIPKTSSQDCLSQ